MKLTLLTITLFSILVISPGDVFSQTNEILMANAKAAIDKQDYPAAITALDTIIKREPRNDDAYAQKARAYVRQNKLDLALPEAEKAIKINPKNYEALNVRGIVRRDQLKDKVGALDDFNKALAVKSDYYFAALNQGITLSMMGRLSDASAAYDKAAALDPKSSGPYAQRARFLMRYGRYQQAIPDLDKVISLDPNNSNNYAVRGYAHLRLFIDAKSTMANVKSDAEKALQLSDRSDLGYALRGLVRYEENAIDPALADAEKAIQLNPKGYLAYVLRGFIKYLRKDFDGSFEDMETALSIVPTDKWVARKRDSLLDKATSPRAQQKKAEVLAAKTAAVETELESAKKDVADNPWDFRSYDALNDAFSAYTGLKKGDSSMEKRAYWEKLISDNPNNICAIRFLGEYKGARYFMDMVNFLDDGLRRYDGKNGTECAAQIAFRIGREYSDRNDYKEADSYFARAKQLKPDLQYLESNIAVNNQKKDEDARFRAEIDAAYIRSSPGGSQSTSSPSVSKTAKPLDKAKVAEAIKEYDRVHESVERDLTELQSAVKKYASAGLYRTYYTGTYQRITSIEVRMITKISDLLTKYGKFLPQELKSHIEQDRQKIYDVDIPSPWQ